jgi:D-alanyl-D-alanine carboxypeptidase
VPSSAPPTETAQPTPLGTFSPPRTLTPDTGLAATIGSQLQDILDQQRADYGAPAIAASIAFPDGSIWSSASGVARIDPQVDATGDTPFVVGSVSKTFVSAAVMKLADDGQLSIDDPLAKFMPDYPNAANITLRQLLHHTSGIYDYFAASNYDSLVFGSMRGHAWTPDEILSTFAHAPYFEPGAGYHYSNTNFILLGLVVESVTGKRLGDVYRDWFFGPLGLANTTFQGSGPPPSDAAEGYLERPKGLKEQGDDTDYRPNISAATVAWAAGAIDGSAHDITTWGDALYGGHLVSPGALAQMEDWTYYPATDETYGLGTRSRVIQGERVFGHTGSIRGFDAAMWHFPELNMTVTVLTNLGRIDANPIVDELMAVAYPAANGIGRAGPADILSLGRPVAQAAAKAPISLAKRTDATLQQVLDQQRVALHIPGAAAAVIFPDGSIWKAGSGLAQIAPDGKSTPKVPFVVGSITKTFVTAALMQLADEGKLTIDDPLSNWLPDFPRADQITLRQLLGHTSGVYNYFEHPTYNKRVFQKDKTHYWTPEEILEDFVGAPYCDPGACYHYSNTGFILLGLVIEKQTGLPLGKVLKQRFFKPLGLKHTYFQGTAAPPASSAQGYLYKNGVWKEWSDATTYRPTISAASVAWSAGGIVSSSRDVAKWAAALYGGQVVSEGALAAMEDYTYAPGSNGTYGLGTWSRVKNGMRMFGHTGSLRGFDAAMWFYPGTGLTVVVLTNLGRVNINPITDALAAAALPAARAYRDRAN